MAQGWAQQSEVQGDHFKESVRVQGALSWGDGCCDHSRHPRGVVQAYSCMVVLVKAPGPNVGGVVSTLFALLCDSILGGFAPPNSRIGIDMGFESGMGA